MSAHQLFALFSTQLQFEFIGGEDESVFCNLPEVRISLRDHAQPCVFELARAPLVAQCAAISGEKLFCQGKDRPGIKDGERIKCNGLDLCFWSLVYTRITRMPR